MKRSGITAFAAALLLAAIGCGGDDDSSGEPLSADEQQDLCDRNCSHLETCDGVDYDTCNTDCLDGAPLLASGAANDFVDCLTESCDSDQDACLLDIDLRGIVQDALDACSDFETRCEIDTQGFCDPNEPEGGALLKLYSDDVLNDLIDCFAEPCDTVEDCVLSAIGAA